MITLIVCDAYKNEQENITHFILLWIEYVFHKFVLQTVSTLLDYCGSIVYEETAWLIIWSIQILLILCYLSDIVSSDERVKQSISCKTFYIYFLNIIYHYCVIFQNIILLKGKKQQRMLSYNYTTLIQSVNHKYRVSFNTAKTLICISIWMESWTNKHFHLYNIYLYNNLNLSRWWFILVHLAQRGEGA